MKDHSFQNKLDDESSPYLLQHAHNPVDWYPWGKKAFEQAQKEEKPVFVSIGYATCHWCHVMAHESFEDEEIAGLLNDAFINIKVDREERPDIDNTYMLVCQMLTGSGGWPLNVWLTPDKKPFYAATYIPKTGRHGRPGMQQLIPRLSELWRNEREKITDTTDKITDAFQQSIQSTQGEYLDSNILNKAYHQYASRYDEQYGGFGSAPKFPSSHNLMLLLRYAKSHPDSKALKMVENTLIQMRLGGLFDQIGFGFHRYSTDQQWLVPHFEKMLYDQAMLLMAYTEGWQLTKNELFKQTAEEIIQYLNRKMRDEQDGFYSAEDADSEGEEGKFYVWSTDEIKQILTKDEAEIFIQIFNLEDEGNYSDESTGQLTGKNIPYLNKSVPELVEDFGIDASSLNAQLTTIRKKLLNKRKQRVHPLLDDKILTDWNGLMIAALAKTGRTFHNRGCINQAEDCYRFIEAQMIDENGKLMHRWRQNESAINAFADDYAFLIWGLIELYETTFETEYLQKAVSLNNQFIDQCWDQQKGGFYTSQSDGEELLGRKKEFYDGALPSANSVAMLNLLRLGRMTGNTEWETMADEMNQLFSSQVKKAPTGFGFALQSIFFADEPKEIIIAGRKDDNETQQMLQVLNEHYLPNAVVLFRDPDDEVIGKIAPYLTNFSMQRGKPTAYVCENYSCDRPVYTATALAEML